MGGLMGQQQTSSGALVRIDEYISIRYVACAYWRLAGFAATAPPMHHMLSHVFRGKADPFRVSSPNSKPPFLFHDETPARWRMPTGGAGEGANPQVRGYWGSGVHWGGPARDSGRSPPLGSAPGHHRPVVFNSGQPAHLAGRR